MGLIQRDTLAVMSGHDRQTSLRQTPWGHRPSNESCFRGPSRWQRVATVVVLLLLSLMSTTPAYAHAELRQASPDVGQTVGGEFHSIAMQFTGLDPAVTHQAKLFDPAGNQIDTTLAAENQRLVLPIEPLSVPGEYTVTYAVRGIDGDFTEDSFSFRFDPAADEPDGITVAVAEPGGFDFVGYALLLAAAALAAFLVHRFFAAYREHRASQSS